MRATQYRGSFSHMTAAPAFASRRRPSTELSASSAAADSNGLLEQQGGLSAALNSLDQTQIDMAVQRAVERLSGSDASTDVDAAAMSRAIQEEVHSVFESELAAVHTAFEQEMVNTKQTVKDVRLSNVHCSCLAFECWAHCPQLESRPASLACVACRPWMRQCKTGP
jgi:hypothetical protein